MELPNGIWTPEIIFIDFAQTSMQDWGGHALLVSWMCVRMGSKCRCINTGSDAGSCYYSCWWTISFWRSPHLKDSDGSSLTEFWQEKWMFFIVEKWKDWWIYLRTVHWMVTLLKIKVLYLNLWIFNIYGTFLFNKRYFIMKKISSWDY